MKLHSYAQLIFDKVAKNIWWRKSSLFNKCCWENRISAYRKLKLDLCLSPCTSVDSQCIKDLNVRPETLKLVQEIAGDTPEAIGIDNDILNWTWMTQQLRKMTDKWDYMQLRSFCTIKEIFTKLKGLPTEWEKLFTSYISDKGSITRICKEHRKLNSPKINSPLKKWANELNKAFSKKEVQKTHE
jgi:hypothetical protein